LARDFVVGEGGALRVVDLEEEEDERSSEEREREEMGERHIGEMWSTRRGVRREEAAAEDSLSRRGGVRRSGQ